MAKKAIRREDVEIRLFTDDVFMSTRVDKNRHIFQRKDGTEYITNGGDVTRDWVKKVKETGGSIIVLPP